MGESYAQAALAVTNEKVVYEGYKVAAGMADSCGRIGTQSEAFREVRLNGHCIISVTPKLRYEPLFAYVVWSQRKFMSRVGVTGLEPATSWSRTTRATNCATPRHLFIVARTRVY
jgi:hypothetical protein